MTATADPDAAPPAFDDARARRNLAVLVFAQAVLGAQLPILFLLGGLAGQTLATDKALATLPISASVLATMAAAPAVSALMGRFGRRPGFVLGALAGAAGAGLGALALIRGDFWLLVAGAALTGVYMAAQGFYRFAAADGASAALRPRAISWVMAAGLVSAVLGPQLATLTMDALAPTPFAGAYLAAAALSLFGGLVFLFLDAPPPPRAATGAPTGRPLLTILRQPRVAVAVICAMVSYALMNMVMTSTPLAIVGCGFDPTHAAGVVQAHVLAMFAPSFVTGRLIVRFGAERIVAVGLALLGACAVVALQGVRLEQFYGALILLGVGWNFGFIGATAMLTASHRPEEQAKVQGANDFLVFGLVSVASLSSGALMDMAGWEAVNLAMVPFLTLAGAALLWLRLSRRRPA
jgi:MFS family permease